MKEMDEVGLEGRYTKLPVEPDRQIADRPPPAWQTTREWGGGKPRMEARAKTTTAPSLPPLFSGTLACPVALLHFARRPDSTSASDNPQSKSANKCPDTSRTLTS